ncbi:hypothetical protein L873DRAFT_1666814 [Choiromyces venosus 120613-1]|uniref:Uncharacterized protein n=1 Tax=Choiromyces venosus 120613-1 TaxID=1336337 RepID=A0A3N4K233_9PEZI|nr:hypothetical protein L873DRAFT_1666814 [Choiromyces venosus 120613-1]
MRSAQPKSEKGKSLPQGNDHRQSPTRPISGGISLLRQNINPNLTTTDSENGGSSGSSPYPSGETRPVIPPKDHRRGYSRNSAELKHGIGMELVTDPDAPGFSDQPFIHTLHDQWDLEIDLIGGDGDMKQYLLLKVKAQFIGQLSQRLGERVNTRANEAEGDTCTKLSIHTKKPDILLAIISVVHGVDPTWSIDCFEDFFSLATTCWEFGCRTDRLGSLLKDRPTWPPDDSNGENQAPIEQWIFAALVFEIPEMFEGATHKMVMNPKPEGTSLEPVESLLPVYLSEKIEEKGIEISRDIISWVRTHIKEYLDQPERDQSGHTEWAEFVIAIHNCLKSVGCDLLGGADQEDKSPSAAHLLEALESLPLQPPAANTGGADLDVPTLIADSKIAPSHASGSSGSSGSSNPASVIPPRRARTGLVIANAVVDLWSKRTAFSEKIKKAGSRDFDEGKYIRLVKNLHERLRKDKLRWDFKGFDLKQFVPSTDDPQRSPGMNTAEENGTH